MWLALVIVLVAPIVVVAGIAALKPKTFRVERRARIDAAPERVFSFLNDFHQWPVWSPWEKLDPAMRRTHRGRERGAGAVYEWDGNKKAGRGRMEILEAVPPSRLVIGLHFLAPFEAHNTTEFVLTPAGSGTDVTWAMYGVSPFLMNVMTVFTSMDKLVGKDFEAGLANLERAAGA
ncbi:MAG: SRPBCC family protein [Acidobacteria bacterium]|nr:SRPBCC family protein [Acidobacteriota bacterium]